jgi:putative ABC transport system permease protein
MILKDLLHETYTSIFSNKVRSGLTMLGIIIGIGSVISLIAIGQGAQGTIQASIASIGSNLVMVSPGAARVPGQVSSGRGTAETLTQADSDAIAKLSLAQAVAPTVTNREQVTAKGTNTNTSVIGTNASYAAVRNETVQEGVFITDQDTANLSKVAVLGPTTRDDLFGVGAEAIGQTIRINNVNFKVVGILTSKGGSGFSNQDDVIIIPISVSQHYLSGSTYVGAINIEAVSQAAMTDLETQVTNLLLSRHNISNPANADFTVLNQADIVSAASSVTSTFTILLGSVAGISLLVGGIGIMNMMLTTVTERTKEIGLRKAIGAKKKDINLQFLIEAVMLTFMGGLIGVLGGYLVSFVASSFFGIASSVSISSVLLAFGVSAGIGIVFGYYPARRASSLNPIEALRYE